MALNDCLSLFPVQALNRQALAAGWRVAFATLGEGEDQGFARPDFDDDSWMPLEVPRLNAAIAGREAMWYRLRFPRPRHRQRTLLRFEGAFLVANVWLNGRLLGSHYGYFAPFSFDISSFLADENVLAVCVEAPVELALEGKRHVMGVFNDWDCKPYPNQELGRLPEEFVWQVPLGLWQPVYAEQVGHLVVEWVHCETSLERADAARLGVRLRVRNLDGRTMAGDLAIRVMPENFQGGEPLGVRRGIRLAGHEVEELTVELGLREPRRWWSWSHGEPALYRLELTLQADDRESARLQELFGVRDARLDMHPEGWKFNINGQPLFLRGANYCSQFFLDGVTAESAGRDVTLARNANMEMLRVHAHLEPPVFYEAADRAGMLVWQDFPLIFSYAHRAEARVVSFFHEAVHSQVEEMAHLLFNHPSVVCYAVHNEPPWCDAFAWLGERHTEQLNRDVDEEAAARLRALDPGRSVLAASGDRDQHLYHGWYYGHWRDLGDQTPVFVSEVGAQALPNPNSPVWRQLNRSWPIADDDPQWRFAGYQPPQWARSGIGPPSAHVSRDAYIRASQDYQAHLLRFAIERFRRQKFAPCGGVLLFQLVDCFPGISWSILDHARRAKRAYRTVTEAMAPIVLVADLPPGGVDGLLQRIARDRPNRFRIVCVNDDPHQRGRARLRWSVVREGARGVPWWRRLRAGFARRRFHGQALVELPDSTQIAAVLAEPVLRLRAEGLYRLVAELEADAGVVARLEQPFLVGAPEPAAVSEDRAGDPALARADLVPTR